jgi:hypothetical protein
MKNLLVLEKKIRYTDEKRKDLEIGHEKLRKTKSFF